jgi:hypothetical protein
MKSELFVERIAASFRPDIVSPSQGDGAAQSRDLSSPPGMKVLLFSVCGGGQETWQFVVKE